ncbi:unnamed protein product [Lactuca virosa]|uniref:Uncharacterized protein n=1 Tax=Lactuca virosa TaxID=75947 RepID=A0AAU9M798_9ASTR|nr:unnamed protein product [Lactuca virosa]
MHQEEIWTNYPKLRINELGFGGNAILPYKLLTTHLPRFKHLKPSLSSFHLHLNITRRFSPIKKKFIEMTVLRSRKVVSVAQNEHSHKPVKNEAQIEPSTPAKEVESTNKSSYEATPSPRMLGQSSDKLGSGSVSSQELRRSARLSSKSSSCNFVEIVVSRRKRKTLNHGNGESGGYESDVSNVRVPSELDTSTGCEANGMLVSDLGTEEYDKDKEEMPSVKKLKNGKLPSQDFNFLGSESVQESDVGNKSLNFRSSKKLLKPGKELSSCKDEKGTEEVKSETVVNGVSQVSLTIEDKQKGVLVDCGELGLEKKIKTNEAEEMENDDVSDTMKMSSNIHEIEEKGKGKVGEADSSSNLSNSKDDSHVSPQQETTERAETSTRNKERFKNIARENASRFAYFSIQEEKQEDEDEDEQLELQTEENGVVEDWPGPFSTAMKIIKDRAENTGQQNSLTSEILPSVPLTWVPKTKPQHEHVKKRVAPSLQELCMPIIAENVDAITSLESVPDVIRHKLTQKLCDTRKMNPHFLDLLASGSPSEIRVHECSWLSEEQLTKTINKTDISKLNVLQLDQCGRCLPDYVIFTTLAHLKMSELTNISLRGACRLSDAGLNVLLTSAPSLRSINLGCCSLLTSEGIINLADKLGSILKELYIDDCFGLDPIEILPALLKLENLEVLSISRFETVNDSFIKQLVGVRGHNIKELILADCTKLTDKSLKAIAESCPGLCSIDLTNLCRLTDTAIGHLANGCRGIQTMKFGRNVFSDEAVAAYIEACGQSLKELSLNHVDKVANHTALSLAKHARNLQSLDLSWCRNMTNEAVGLIVDSCLSLRTIKLFGCTQITNVFLDGHSNEEVKVIGLKESEIIKNVEMTDLLPLRYSSAT